MSQGMGFEDSRMRMMVVIISSLIFCAIVMPAWIIHIVPHSIMLEDGQIHAKDYDDHESPSARNAVNRSASMKTHAGDYAGDEEAPPMKSPSSLSDPIKLVRFESAMTEGSQDSGGHESQSALESRPLTPQSTPLSGSKVMLELCGPAVTGSAQSSTAVSPRKVEVTTLV